MVEHGSAELDRIFRVLADPTRRGILERLARSDSELSVTEISCPYAMSLAAVSKHLKALEGAGLVKRAVHGREHRFRLRPERLADAYEWLGFYERFWNQRIDALARLLDDDADAKIED